MENEFDDYNNYIHWKTKYLELKKNIGDNIVQYANGKKTYDFYITHGTSKLSNLLSILKDGKIKLGKDVSKQNRMLSKGKSNKYIYGNIFFDDFIKSMDNYIDYTIILDPKIIEDYDMEFRTKWSEHPESNSLEHIYKNDNSTVKSDKLSKIKSFVKKGIGQKPNIIEHEILFDKPIDISKYILGVTCINCDSDFGERYTQIKKILKRNSRSHVKIITNNKPVSYSYLTK